MPMSPELMELLERFVIAVERIADVMEVEAMEDQPDAESMQYMSGERVK